LRRIKEDGKRTPKPSDHDDEENDDVDIFNGLLVFCASNRKDVHFILPIVYHFVPTPKSQEEKQYKMKHHHGTASSL